MTLSKLVAELSEVMAEFPNDDPQVELRISISADLHDSNGKEIGSVQVDEFIPMGEPLAVTTNGKLIGIWLAGDIE